MPPELSVLVIHHKTPALLRDCLSRLSAYAPAASVTVVDTESLDGSEELVRQEFPGTAFITAPNHSMANPVNTGLKACRTPYVCHMNADVMVEAHTFEALLTALRQPGVGMVGPRCLTPAGKLQDQGLPYRRHHQRLEQSGTLSVDVPWLSGCMQVVKLEAVRAVGGMDSSLRFYNEDMEWCWRMRRAGYRCSLVKTEVLHLGGSSTPRLPRFLVEGYRGGYRLSQRYKPRPYRLLHTLAVRAEAAWQERFHPDATRRDAYRLVTKMFRKGCFDESPFGGSLDEDNPHFCAE